MINSKIYFLLLIQIIFIGLFTGYARSNPIPSKLDYVLIYYINPEAKLVTGILKSEMEDSSAHNILIKNASHIKFLMNLFNNLPSSDSKPELGSISFKIIFQEKFHEQEIIYIDYVGDYEFSISGKKGSIPEKDFKELLEFTEGLTNSIDLRFMEKRILELKGGIPCDKDKMDKYSKFYCENPYVSE